MCLDLTFQNASSQFEPCVCLDLTFQNASSQLGFRFSFLNFAMRSAFVSIIKVPHLSFEDSEGAEMFVQLAALITDV